MQSVSELCEGNWMVYILFLTQKERKQWQWKKPDERQKEESWRDYDNKRQSPCKVVFLFSDGNTKRVQVINLYSIDCYNNVQRCKLLNYALFEHNMITHEITNLDH